MDRRFILSAIAGMAAVPRATYAISVWPSNAQRLRLLNPHTNETFVGPYRDAKGPIPTAMADLSAFLRDFHSDTITAIDVGVVDFLATVIGAINAQTAIILSAYRTLETNAALARTTFGVAENSQHLYGRALDVRFESRLREAMLVARAMRRGGVGWYERSGFIHIDTGPVRNWELGDTGLDTMLIGNNPTRTRLLESLNGIDSGQIKPNLNQSGRHLRELDLSGNIAAELNHRGRFFLDLSRRK